MARTAAVPGAPAAALSFEKLRRGVAFLSALTAFGSLFMTGEVQLWAGALFLAGWAAGVALGGAPRWWRPVHGVALNLIAILVLLRVARTAAFTSVLDMLLFLALTKCYTLRTARDHLQVQIICFFILLSTAVITVSFFFVFFFAAYLALATAGLMLHGMAPPDGSPEAAGAALPRRFLRGVAAGTAALTILTVALFVLVPHVSMEKFDAPLSRREAPPEKLTGFGEEIEFGHFKQLEPDGTVVMRVEVSWPQGRSMEMPGALRLRGNALDHYDEARWARSPLRPPVPFRTMEQINPAIESAQWGVNTNLRIYQNPDVTLRLFAAPWALSINLGRGLTVMFDERNLGAQVMTFGKSRESAYTNPFVYEVKSVLVEEAEGLLGNLASHERRRRGLAARLIAAAAPPGPDDPPGGAPERAVYSGPALEEAATPHRTAPGAKTPGWITRGRRVKLAASERLLNLQLPSTPLTEKIAALARTAAPGPSPADSVQQALRFFRRDFTYSLAPETPPGVHPIDAFLFQTKSGHCEYFATALVLLMRAQGIPARIVNGFYSTEFNRLAGVFVVKQSDAHAWTEVWIDGMGWLTVDPTPPGSAGRAGYGRIDFSMLDTVSDYLRILWQRHVVDFSADKQTALLSRLRESAALKPVFGAMEAMRDAFRPSGRRRSGPGGSGGAGGEDAGEEAATRINWAAVGLLVSVIGLFIVAALRRTRGRSSRRSGVDYLDALLRAGEASGARREPGQTPAEYAASLAARGWNAGDAGWIVDLYYRHRYGGEPPGREERRRAMELVRAARKAAARGGGAGAG